MCSGRSEEIRHEERMQEGARVWESRNAGGWREDAVESWTWSEVWKEIVRLCAGCFLWGDTEVAVLYERVAAYGGFLQLC